MLFQNFIKLILRRPPFRGQNRLFNYLFKFNILNRSWVTVKPIQGDFKINCNTSTWIGAKIVYTGEYEAELKKVFKSHIKQGFTVLDVGANIGFHTLYFSELVGPSGKVIAFEPVPLTYANLEANLQLNYIKNVVIYNLALGNKKEEILINTSPESNNPGAFNLFDTNGETKIKCEIGDDILKEEKIDFIKIDVEGYEAFVLQGLTEVIKKNKPIIVFEFDKNYHVKTNLPPDFIFKMLTKHGYNFQIVGQHHLQSFEIDHFISGNILAKPSI